jgi:hypothetical protein
VVGESDQHPAVSRQLTAEKHGRFFLFDVFLIAEY